MRIGTSPSAQPATDLDTVEPGTEVEDHQVEDELRRSRERAVPVCGGADVVPLLAQEATQDVGDLGVVLDYEHTPRCHLASDHDHIRLEARIGLAPRFSASLRGGGRGARVEDPYVFGKSTRGTRGRKPASTHVQPKRRRSAASANGWGGVAGIDQRYLDLIGLALVAVATYLFCVLYLGWDGGRVGAASESALGYVAGACAVVVPLALAGAGVALVLRPFISSRRR